tara:strand:- start:1294 stop:1419 length:126 start_codon:yes stop_codon:yes gene_type:complete
MSCHYTEVFLERYYEEGLDMGMTEEQAEAYAYKMLEEAPQP